MSGFCRDVLQRKLLVPGDATPCYILGSTSEPLTQNLPPGSQNLTFSTSSFNLCIFTDGLRMTVPFCSNFYSFVPRQNEKCLQMFLQNQSCIRTSLLISASLVGWGRGRQLRFESLLCLSQSTIFQLTNPSCMSQGVFHSTTKEGFVQLCKANCKPETA